MADDVWTPTLGAVDLGAGRWRVRVWAPYAKRVELALLRPKKARVALSPASRGYFETELSGLEPGQTYAFRLNGKDQRPDPASRFQPAGVHKPSALVSRSHRWSAAEWKGIPLEDYVLYELHVGTFSEKGTFEGVADRLDHLVKLGITAVEIMPVAQFPGSRNWGYDGVHPYAVQNTYGGPDGFKRLIDLCHRKGLAVVLDVVYNHFGPEGNYLGEFGPYFTDRYRTPWGKAINFDDRDSDEVRAYFIENALTWIVDYRVDALRLDAVHAIWDFSAYPFLRELKDRVAAAADRLGRRVHLIAESDLNDGRLIRPHDQGGFGLDAQWSDDFHHSLHALLTGESTGYYADFGSAWHLEKAWRDRFVYAGEYAAFRRRRFGNRVSDRPARQFVVCSQNHDQVGNRMKGERLSALVSFERSKLAAGAVLLSPYLPLLFMGEEYGETNPFQYFVSHTDKTLVEAVRKGRAREFRAFGWREDPPDPQSLATFNRSILDGRKPGRKPFSQIFELYRELIALRKAHPAIWSDQADRNGVRSDDGQKSLCVHRRAGGSEIVVAFNFSESRSGLTLSLPRGRWERRIDSSDERWGGPGSELPEVIDKDNRSLWSFRPNSFVVMVRTRGDEN